MNQPASGPSNIVTDVLFSIVTCGIYNLFWQARQFRDLNAFLGEERFNFWQWFLLTIITCGIYHVYTEYLIGVAIVEVQQRRALPVSANMPVICLLVSLCGLTLAADAIQQSEINKFY